MADVTVLMPVYNAARHVREAIESVLAQTHRDFEFLIVDDGSTDQSAAIVAAYRDSRIRLIRSPRNEGLSAALNRGLAQAQGELIARQDADDRSHPQRIERQVQALERRADVALIGCQANAIDEGGRPLADVERSQDEVSIRWYALFDNPFIHSSVMFRKQVIWNELGGFEASFDPYSQDYELWGRVMQRYSVFNLRDRLMTYRVSTSSIIGAVDAADPADAYRARFEGVVRTLVTRHLRTFVDAGTLSDADAMLMTGYVLGIDARALPRFLDVFRALLRRFQERHPEWRSSVDFRRTLARQFDAIAYRVRPPSRRAALTTYFAGLRREPSIASHLPWSRALALCVLGASGRDRLARIRHAAPPALHA